MKRILCLLLACLLLIGLFGCGQEKQRPRPTLNNTFPGQTLFLSFGGTATQPVQLSAEGAQAVLDATAQPVDYPYADFYRLEELESRLSFDASVDTHRHSALDADHNLTGSHLAALVAENNKAFLSTKPFGYEDVESDYLLELCDFLVSVVKEMQLRCPDLDWARIYCNLGDLKILYNVGMLSFAQVDNDRILTISRNNTNIVLNMKGEDGFSRVMTHETMHLLQLGCGCEQIPECGRRAGFCVYWDDLTWSSGDWTWFLEGSAERNMMQLTGGDAISYQYKVDYLCSMTLSVLLREDVDAQTVETLSFYSDPQLLFDAFGCTEDAQRQELLLLMTTLQVLQMEPSAFFEDYRNVTGIDLRENDDTLNDFNYRLKPAVCISLSQYFYRSLTQHLQQQTMDRNDIFFLIALFEGHMNQHLGFASEAKKEINKPFFTRYAQLRQTFFDAMGDDARAQYDAYAMVENGSLNATFDHLSAQERQFLAERAQWLQELGALGVKAP